LGAVVGQDFFLFSWTLLAVDIIIAILLLFVSFFLLLVGSSLTTVTVVNTLVNSVLGALTSYLLVTPLTAFLGSLLTRSVLDDIKGRLKANEQDFVTWYNVLSEDEMLAQDAQVPNDPDIPTPQPAGSSQLLATLINTQSRVTPLPAPDTHGHSSKVGGE
jgi:hypothetical protein